MDGRPLRARTSESLRGRLWTLTYAYGTVFARLGGGRALAGRCGGGVGGVGGAPTVLVCGARLCAHSVLHVCLFVVKIALHLIFARLKVCTFDNNIRYQHSPHAHDLDRPTDARLPVPLRAPA